MQQNVECDIMPIDIIVIAMNPECDIIPNKCGPLSTTYNPLPNLCSPLPTVTHTAHYLTHTAHYLAQFGQDKQTTQPNIPIIRITLFLTLIHTHYLYTPDGPTHSHPSPHLHIQLFVSRLGCARHLRSTHRYEYVRGGPSAFSLKKGFLLHYPKHPENENQCKCFRWSDRSLPESSK